MSELKRGQVEGSGIQKYVIVILSIKKNDWSVGMVFFFVFVFVFDTLEQKSTGTYYTKWGKRQVSKLATNG